MDGEKSLIISEMCRHRLNSILLSIPKHESAKLTGYGGTVVFWISPVILYTFKGIVIKV